MDDGRVGQPLPEFRAPSSHGQTLDRASFVGKVGIVMFVPEDGALRDAELAEWDERLVDFGHLRMQVLGVIRSTAKALRDESERDARAVTLLADEDGQIEQVVSGGNAPAPTLVTDRSGTIVDVIQRDSSTGHVTEVLKRVRSLQEQLGDSMRPDV